MNTNLKIIFPVALSIPLLAGCVIYRDRPAYGPPPSQVVVESPPPMPTPHVEMVPMRPGPPDIWVWVPGCWEWRGNNYIWIGGRWATRPHPGAIWVPAHWDRHGHRATWIPGHWR